MVFFLRIFTVKLSNFAYIGYSFVTERLKFGKVFFPILGMIFICPLALERAISQQVSALSTWPRHLLFLEFHRKCATPQHLQILMKFCTVSYDVKRHICAKEHEDQTRFSISGGV